MNLIDMITTFWIWSIWSRACPGCWRGGNLERNKRRHPSFNRPLLYVQKRDQTKSEEDHFDFSWNIVLISIQPQDLDKAKTKAAMLGEGSPGHQYTYILPKNPTTQIIFPNQVKSPVTYILEFKYLSNTFQATFATSTKLMEPKPPRYFCPIQQWPRTMTIFLLYVLEGPCW